MSDKLLNYYGSNNEEVSAAKKLIEELEEEGQLQVKSKNIILSWAERIYNIGKIRSGRNIAKTIKQLAEKDGIELGEAITQHLDQYEMGTPETLEAVLMNQQRMSKDEYYVGITEAVLKRSTCLRRRYGAIIVKNDEIIATGYNGSPRGETNCIDLGYCEREHKNVPKGERYEICVAVHAEQNACLSAGRESAIGATMYIVGREVKTWEHADPTPCIMCRRVIKQVGISRVVGIYKNHIYDIKI